MAGVVLLVSKNSRKTKEFYKKADKIERFVNRHFARHFKYISFQNPKSNHYLIHFRKDDKNKFYQTGNGSWLTYSGHVFSLNETRMYDAEELWFEYKKNGKALPKKLDGQFVIKIYDSRSNSFLIFNDFAKNRTEFLTKTDDYLLFSPFLLLSAAIKKPELDLHAFNEFMWRYYILSNRTMLKGTRRLSPATLYEIHKGVLKSRKYWNWPEQYTTDKFPQAVEQLSESMKESARLMGQFGIEPLIEFTMGQDSRQIVSAFTNQKLSFISTIYGKDDFYEVEKVKEMTSRHRIRNYHVKLSEDYVINPFPYFKTGILLGNGEEPGYLIGRILHMRSQYLKSSSLILNGTHGRYYKDGLWNELYVSNFYREPSQLSVGKLLKFRVMNKNFKSDIFSNKFLRIKSGSKEYFADLIQKSVKPVNDSPVSIQLDKFDAEHYGNFGLASNTVCDSIIDVLSPLLLRRNLEPALAFPVSWKYNLSNIQRAVVHNLDSELAREITDFSEITMTPKSDISMMWFLSRYWFAQSQKLRDKFKNRLGFHVTTQLQKAWDYAPIYRTLTRDDAARNMLNYDHMAISDILDKKSWNEYIDHFYNSDMVSIDQYEYLLKILSVEMFLQLSREV